MKRMVGRVPNVQIRGQGDRGAWGRFVEKSVCRLAGHRWMMLEYLRDGLELEQGVLRYRRRPGQAYIGCGRCLAEIPEREA